ncbi:MAG: PAS domain S-box protein [Gemmatimonadota bacterium]
MRDQHRSREELINDVVGLRKQVEDLKSTAVIRRRVEDALRVSEERCRSLIEACPLACCRLDPSGDPQLVNPSLIRLLGYESRAIFNDLARIHGLFISSEERSRVLDPQAAGDTLQQIETHLRRKDGEALSIHLQLRAVRGLTGALEGFELFIANIPALEAIPQH